jgi:hypothetical protein
MATLCAPLGQMRRGEREVAMMRCAYPLLATRAILKDISEKLSVVSIF